LHGVVFAFFVLGPSVHYLLLHQQHIHRHRELLLARADDDAIDRRDVGEVAPDRQDDVVVLDQEVIGRIEPDPADRAAAPHRDPGVGGVGGLPNRCRAGDSRPIHAACFKVAVAAAGASNFPPIVGVNRGSQHA